jgi:hypothetical protein
LCDLVDELSCPLGSGFVQLTLLRPRACFLVGRKPFVDDRRKCLQHLLVDDRLLLGTQAGRRFVVVAEVVETGDAEVIERLLLLGDRRLGRLVVGIRGVPAVDGFLETEVGRRFEWLSCVFAHGVPFVS